MNSGRSIARAYRDADGRSPATAPGTSFRQVWLVGVLVLVSACWPTTFRAGSAPAGRPVVDGIISGHGGAEHADVIDEFLRAPTRATHR